MSDTHLYLPLVPECLVASMLPPDEFGAYLAVGSTSRFRGQAVFFELDPDFQSEHFPMHLVPEQCVTKENGKPKNSLYLSIYQVLEHIPLNALGNLHLATDDGKVLTLTQGEYQPETDRFLHLFQEFGPVNPTVASTLDAVDFCQFVTSPDEPVRLPKVVFSELILRDLATAPASGKIGELPYDHIEHLRHGLIELSNSETKKNKVIYRRLQQDFFFRTIRNGFFAGDQTGMKYYPMPSPEELENQHYSWWKSAVITHH